METLLLLLLYALALDRPDRNGPSAPTEVVLTDSAHVFKVDSVGVLVDLEGIWSIDDVQEDSFLARFVTYSEKERKFGYSGATFWIRFRMEAATNRTWLVEVAEKSVDHIELYTSIPDFPVLRSGDGMPFHSRPVRHRRLLLPLPDAPRYDVFLRLSSNGPIKAPLKIWESNALAQATRREEFGLGIFFGILIIMVLYNVVLFAALRDKSFLLFAFFVGSFTLYQAGVERIAFEYLWPENIWWMDRSNSLMAVVCAAWGVLFTQSFLEARWYAPRLNRALTAVFVLCILYALVVLVGPPRVTNQAVVYFVLLLAPFLLVSGVVCIVNRDRQAILYLIGWAILLVGLPVAMFGYLGFPPDAISGTSSVRTVTFAGIVLLSQIGLGYRYDQLRREREALRNRIATDLHDEIGSGLTQISLYSELIRRESSGTAAAWAEDMGEHARELTGKMQDIVWALHHGDEDWSALELRMKDFSTRLLAPNQIAFDMQGEVLNEPERLMPHIRHNLLLIFKEIVHNAVRHSECSRISVSFRIDRRTLWMRISDDGKGFDVARVHQNNGLQNLRHRAVEINSELRLETCPGGPTCYELSIPLVRNYQNV